MTNDAARLEATRWRVAAEWALPVSLLTGDTEDEFRRSAAALRPEYFLPGVPGRRRPGADRI